MSDYERDEHVLPTPILGESERWQIRAFEQSGWTVYGPYDSRAEAAAGVFSLIMRRPDAVDELKIESVEWAAR